MWIVYENWSVVQSEAKIRTEMLKKFPVGTEKQTVKIYIKQHYEKGPYDVFERDIGWRKDNDSTSDELIGSSRIRASIYDIGIIDVTVIWLFDDQDKLIEIYTWKTMDMP